MISPANWEGCESEQKVLAQVELFPTFPAFQSESTNKLRDASRSHHSQCHQRAQKNKGKRARTSHTALPPHLLTQHLPQHRKRVRQELCRALCLPSSPSARSLSPVPLWLCSRSPFSGVTASPPYGGVKLPCLTRTFPSGPSVALSLDINVPNCNNPR